MVSNWIFVMGGYEKVAIASIRLKEGTDLANWRCGVQLQAYDGSGPQQISTAELCFMYHVNSRDLGSLEGVMQRCEDDGEI